MEAIGLPYHSDVGGSDQRGKPRLERVKHRERTRISARTKRIRRCMGQPHAMGDAPATIFRGATVNIY